MDGWVDGWMDGWMEAKAGLRIAYSNQQGTENYEQKILKTLEGSIFKNGWIFKNQVSNYI